MKKHLYVVAAFAVLSFLASCAKELEPVKIPDESVMPEPKVTSFEASFDVTGDSTKISFGDSSKKKMPILWSEGDAFRLITCKTEKYYLDTLKKSVPADSLTDCGCFTTDQDGVAKALFTGSIPAGAVSSTEGIAIFPASAYTDNSAKVTVAWNKDKTATVPTSSLVGLSTSIPAEQDGSGARYIVAGARLRNGKLSGFTYGITLVKINVPESLGVEKIELSTQSENKYGLASSDMRMYYYMSESETSRTMSTSITSGQSTTIVVSRDGEVLSGDIYFATRNLKLYINSSVKAETAEDADTARLYLRFYTPTGISKKYTYRLKCSYAGGNVLDFGEFTDVFPEQTKITYDASASQKFVPSYEGASENDEFPWKTSTKPYVFRIKNDTLSSSWYKTERTYTYGGYTWIFGTTYSSEDADTGFSGKYGYNSSKSYVPWIDKQAYIKLPVVDGKRLVAVRVTIINSASQVWFRISSNNSASSTDPGLVPDSQLIMSKNEPLTLLLTNTSKNTPYYMISASSWQPSKIELYYQ